jgi:hypothetical protein
MISVLAAPLFLLVFAVFDGPVSRLMGAKLAATILFSTGIVVAGFGWRAVVAGGCDVAVILGGAALARRHGLSTGVWRRWVCWVSVAFSTFLVLSFASLALIATLLNGLSIDTVSFDFGFLISGLSLALLLSRRQEQVFTRSGAGSFVAASPQA